VSVTWAPELNGRELAQHRRREELRWDFVLVFVGAFLAASVAPADAASPSPPGTLYASGQFPPGKTYVVEEVIGLNEGAQPNPTYLTGQFLCIESRADQALFTTYSKDGDELVFGKLVLSVTFLGNRPPGLHAGSVITATSSDPLTIKAVFHRNDLTVVTAESWSLPQNKNNN
jgi:hypothetical protein